MTEDEDLKVLSPPPGGPHRPNEGIWTEPVLEFRVCIQNLNNPHADIYIISKIEISLPSGLVRAWPVTHVPDYPLHSPCALEWRNNLESKDWRALPYSMLYLQYGSVEILKF